MPIDFITLSKIIFKDKDKYKFVEDSDKEKNFFILNRKFAYKDIKKSQFFNNKNISKASSLDIWFSFFKNTTNIPRWYSLAKLSKKKKHSLKNEDVVNIKDRYKLTDKDFDFLRKYYENDIKIKIKKLKKFKKLK